MNIFSFIKPKSDVAYIFSDFTIRQTIEKMNAHKYTAIPMLKRDGTYVGTITEGDLLWFIKENSNLDLRKAEELPVLGVHRTRDNQAVDVNASIDALFKLIIKQNFTPVLDDRKMFIGIVTRRDILTYYQENVPVNYQESVFNPTINTIMARRSIRRYTEEPVIYSDIKTILDAGFAAPSAHNHQPVHIIVIQKPEVKVQLAEQAKYGRMIPSAQVVFAVVADKTIEPNSEATNNDCSAVIQNMLIAIEAIGLGGVWIGVSDDEWRGYVAKTLAIPEHMIVHGLVACGHPAVEKDPHTEHDTNKVHMNRW